MVVWDEPNTIDKFAEGGAKVAWRIELGAGYSGPAIVDGRIFVTDRTKDEGKGKDVENAIRKVGEVAGGERVLCLDEETGEKIWSHTYDCPYSIAYPTGPRSTPTVDGEYVYTLGAMGRLFCFQASDGTIVWQKATDRRVQSKGSAMGYSSHPYIDGDRLFVAVGGEGSGVVAFDKTTGKELWKSVTTFDIAYAPLVMYEKDDEKQLIFWHADSVDSLNPETGEIHWSIKFPKERSASQTSIAMPRIEGNRMLISEYYKGSLMLEIGSNPPSVEEKWRSQESDPRNKTTLNTLMMTPIVKDGLAYCIANDARGKGVFRCIEVESGELVWEKKDWLAEEAQVFATAFVVENGEKCFMFNDLGELMIVRLSRDGFTELSRAKVLESSGVARGREVVWCQPACANGHLVVRNDKEIVRVNLRK